MPPASCPSKKEAPSAISLLRSRVTRGTTIVNQCKVPDANPRISPGLEFLFTAPLKLEQTPVPHPVLAYIMGEMKRNAAHPLVIGLRYANGLIATSESLRKRTGNLTWNVFIGSQPPSVLAEFLLETGTKGMFGAVEAPASVSFTVGNYKIEVGFRDWVRNYLGISAWDYKPDIYKQGWDYRQPIDFSPIGKNEKVTFYYDIWSNIHFGYVGRAAGFSEEDLFWGGDICKYGHPADQG